MTIVHAGMRLAAVLLLFVLADSVAQAQENGSEAVDALEVSDTKVSFNKEEGYNGVILLGKLRNSQPYPVGDIMVEVNYFNEAGELIDTASSDLYSVVVPANGETTFKVVSSAVTATENYRSHSARITFANKVSVSAGNSRCRTAYLLKKSMISWLPLILLMVFWVLWLARMQKKGPCPRLIAITEEQNRILEDNNEAFRQLVAAVERLGKNKS